MKKRNPISGQFSARLAETLESPAYRALTLAAHRVISRIEVELCHHGGNDNGQLPVTYEQFEEYGLNRSSVAPGIRVAEALGFIQVTQKGRAGNAEYRIPNKFYLTYVHERGSKAKPPTHEWRKIKTVEEAEEIAKAAQGAKSEVAVAFGKRGWRRRNKTNPSIG